MEAGKLNKRVTIESPTRTNDAKSNQRKVTSWATVATVSASVWPRSTREIELAEQQQHFVTHEVRMRYRPDVTADCRLKLGTRILAIVGIDNVDERNRELRIAASEKTQGAT